MSRGDDAVGREEDVREKAFEVFGSLARSTRGERDEYASVAALFFTELAVAYQRFLTD